MENECEALPGVAYPGVRDNRSTVNTKTGYDEYDDVMNWVKSKAVQGEAYLATGQIKDAFAHFRNLRAACPRKVSLILDDHGNLISDKAAKAYFEQLLNHPSVPCPDLPSTVQEDQQACQEPSAVQKLKDGKAPDL